MSPRFVEDASTVQASAWPTLIVAPAFSFRNLRERMDEQGWNCESESEAPILPGEPEHAIFVARGDGTSAYYTFNPALLLRILELRGHRATLHRLLLAGEIPVLGIEDIREALTCAEPRVSLRGLFAAREARAFALMPLIAVMASHHDSRIAAAATQARNGLLTAAVENLEEALQARPGAQLLRELLHAASRSNAAIEELLIASLQDTDPEVRVTAIVVAAKLKAVRLAGAIRDANIPTSTSQGAWPRDRLFFASIQQAAVRYLSEPDPGSSPRRRQFESAIAGVLPVHEDTTLLLYSLTNPLGPGRRPERLPDAIREVDGRYHLRRTSVELCFVASVPHWLSDPIRRVTPPAGFFIAKRPVGASSLRPVLEEIGVTEDGDTGGRLLLRRADAEHLCQSLSRLEGTRVRLPTADEWQMSARGIDGRLFPWGNCLRSNGPDEPSPWGVMSMSGPHHEWTADQTEDRQRVVCGGDKMMCATRQTVDKENGAAMFAVRIIVESVGE